MRWFTPIPPKIETEKKNCAKILTGIAIQCKYINYYGQSSRPRKTRPTKEVFQKKKDPSRSSGAPKSPKIYTVYNGCHKRLLILHIAKGNKSVRGSFGFRDPSFPKRNALMLQTHR